MQLQVINQLRFMMLVQECSVMNEDAIVNKNGSSKLVELIVIEKLDVSGKS